MPIQKFSLLNFCAQRKKQYCKCILSPKLCSIKKGDLPSTLFHTEQMLRQRIGVSILNRHEFRNLPLPPPPLLPSERTSHARLVRILKSSFYCKLQV